MAPRHLTLVILLSSALSAMPASSADSQGSILFERTWGGGANDIGRSAAVDNSGKIYVTGDTESFGGSDDVLLLKYDLSGRLEWQRTWGGIGSEAAYGVAVDSAGDIYLTGHTSSFGDWGAFLLKFNPSGELASQQTFEGIDYDDGFDVALGPSGNIYLTGSTGSFGAGLSDVFILKLDTSGGLLWQRTWGGSNWDVAYGAAVTFSGDIYLTGYTESFGAGSWDAFLLKFSSSGDLLWQRTFGGSDIDIGYSVGCDSSENIYVAGSTQSFGAGYVDAFLLKFSSSGDVLWQRTWGGGLSDSAYDVVNSIGESYLAGSTYSFGAGSEDVFIVKVSPSGVLAWQATWGSGQGIGESGSGVVVDSSGLVLVVGDVHMGPPYTLGVGNSTLGIPNFDVAAPSVTAATPSFTIISPSGATQTPSGSETYSGGQDVFLLQYQPPSQPPTPTPVPTAVVLSVFAAGAVYRLISRKRRG